MKKGVVGGLMEIGAHLLSAKEMRWLSAILAGILMCKIVYDLMGVVSASLMKRYRNLNNKQKLEWNNRGFSTFHAIVVAVGSLYLLLASDLFDDKEDKMILNRSSTVSDTMLGALYEKSRFLIPSVGDAPNNIDIKTGVQVSIGYFLSDLAMILYNYPALGGTEYVIHHGLSMYSIIQSLLSGQALIYILMVLFTEATTPFVNLRWYLDTLGMKNSKLYIYNGVALFLGWLVARVLLFVFFFYHMFTHFDQVKQVFPLGYYSLLTVPPVLTMMNAFWFWKITKGMVKTLRKARHSQ